MRKLLKHIYNLIPAFLLASIVLIIPQINNSELMLPTQSGKAFGLLWGMLGYLVITVFIAAIKREMVTLRITTVDLLLGAYCLMVLISYRLHPVDQLQLLSFVALLIFYLGVRVLNTKYQLLLLVAVVVSGTIQAVYGNLQLWGYYPSHHGLFRMTGSFFNPGPYAGYLAAVLPVALGLYFKSLNKKMFEGLKKKMFEGLKKKMFEGLNVRKFEGLKGLNVRMFDRFSNSEVSNPSNPSNPSNSSNPSNFSNPSNISRFFYNNPKCGDTPETQADWLRHTLDSIIQYFAMIAMIAMCLVLPASRSRAAWLAVVVSGGYLLWVKNLPLQQLKARVNTPAKRFFLVSSLFILLISIGAGLYYFKKGSADGRLLIWKVSGEMIKDQLLFGHGADQFAADYMNYQAAYFKPNTDGQESLQADNVTYAYNEFLKLTVEFGLVGLLLALAVLWSLFFLKSDPLKNSDRLSLLAARGGLLSILVFSLFSYPSDILPIRMLLVLLMAIVASHQSPLRLFELGRKETPELPSHKTAFAGTAVLYAALAVALLAVYPASQYLTQQYQAYQSWKDASDIYNVGAYPECLEDFELAYPLLKTNGPFLVQYGKALEMAEKYDSSIVILNQAKYHLNNTILYTCLGNNYKALGKHPEAEQSYLHAWHMAPARFFPLYLLAKLYDETGQNEKAVAMAKEVMEKEVKIESTAVKEIQEKMKRIIENQDNAQDMSNLKGKGRKHNQRVAIASCPAPFLKKESEVR